MIVEILCIGEELLSGKTVNSNASYLSEKVEDLGYDVLYHSVVGDNKDRIKTSLKIAIGRSDIVLMTGGLGPTDDDITIETIAEFFNTELILDENSLKKIKERYVSIGKTMPEINVKQAFRPKNSIIIDNKIGTAPGIIYSQNNKIIIALPGVPYEMKSMWENTVSDYLKNKSNSHTIVKDLKFIGISEAELAEKVRDVLTQNNPSVAPYVKQGEVTLRIKSKSIDEVEAQYLLNITETEILNRTQGYFYGVDESSLESIVGAMLQSKALTVSVAESCTGGLLSSRLTDIPGSSSYTKLNIVTYSNEAKIQMLGVRKETLDSFGAVSAQTVKEMAEGITKLSCSDIGIAISGIAGPNGATETKPVGLIYCCINYKNNSNVYEIRLSDKFSRIQIKERAVKLILNYLRKLLLND